MAEKNGSQLKSYTGVGNEYGKPAYWIVDTDIDEHEYQTLDFMFTAETEREINGLNKYFSVGANWDDKVITIAAFK